MTTNAALRTTYDDVYRLGSQRFFTVNSFAESQAIYALGGDWSGLRVLEIGCGEGRLAALIGMGGAELVDAIDYSAAAVRIAQERIALPNVRYSVGDYAELTGQYDAVVMQGVLEHMDEPWSVLQLVLGRLVSPSGFLVTSSPSFINPRGYVWMTLQLLLDVPMSLTDVHFLCPHDFLGFCEEYGYLLKYETIHHDWGHGTLLVSDFRKRLTNALRDASYDNSHVGRLLGWLEQAVKYESPTQHNGATAIYRIDKL